MLDVRLGRRRGERKVRVVEEDKPHSEDRWNIPLKLDGLEAVL